MLNLVNIITALTDNVLRLLKSRPGSGLLFVATFVSPNAVHVATTGEIADAELMVRLGLAGFVLLAAFIAGWYMKR